MLRPDTRGFEYGSPEKRRGSCFKLGTWTPDSAAAGSRRSGASPARWIAARPGAARAQRRLVRQECEAGDSPRTACPCPNSAGSGVHARPRSGSARRPRSELPRLFAEGPSLRVPSRPLLRPCLPLITPGKCSIRKVHTRSSPLTLRPRTWARGGFPCPSLLRRHWEVGTGLCSCRGPFAEHSCSQNPTPVPRTDPTPAVQEAKGCVQPRRGATRPPGQSGLETLEP